MLRRLIGLSLHHRVFILGLAVLLLIVGSIWVMRVPVDVFPDLSAPTVTVITEGPGMAPEETSMVGPGSDMGWGRLAAARSADPRRLPGGRPVLAQIQAADQPQRCGVERGQVFILLP